MDTTSSQCAIIYTDGSCDTQYCIGAWVAIILIGADKIVLSSVERNTTHNQMELVAVIEAIKYVNNNYNQPAGMHIYSDSQYVTNLASRKQKLESTNFITKSGKLVQNAALVKTLLLYTAANDLVFEKIKAHQKKTDVINYNIEADLLSRKLVREAIKNTKATII